MRQISDRLFLPDEDLDYVVDIYLALGVYGLPEDRFTFAPAKGGVLVYVLEEGLIWIPQMVIESLGAELEGRTKRNISNRGAGSAGGYTGGLLGAYAGAKIATLAILSGLSGGLLAIPILGGMALGGILGKNAMKKLGLRDPPPSISSYSLNTIHHIKLLSADAINKLLDGSKRLIDRFRENDNPFSAKSVVLSIVPRFSIWISEGGASPSKTTKKIAHKTKSYSDKLLLKDDRVSFTFSHMNYVEALLKTMEEAYLDVRGA